MRDLAALLRPWVGLFLDRAQICEDTDGRRLVRRADDRRDPD